MSRKRRIFLALLLCFALAAGLGAGFVPVPAVRAAEDGFVDLNQNQIVEALGAGWNLGNQLEANSNGTPVEDAWTNVKVSERLIRSVKDAGFRSIRIPVSYLSKIGSAPNYKIDGAWLDRVQEVVDMAVKNNLYVIMNIHGDGYSSVEGGWILPEKEDQEGIKAKFGAVWKQIATRFKDYDHHMIFESMNEIGAEIKTDPKIAAAYENINAYNQIFVDTVRKTGGNNAKRWLLIPGFNTNIDYTAGSYGFQIPADDNRSADIPENEKRIMISVHYYTPWEFCGQEDYNQTQWGNDADPDKSVGYGSESDMESQFAKMKTKFVDKGYPVVIGEYGSIDKSRKEDSGLAKEGQADPENAGFRAYFAWRLCTIAKQDGCVPVYWDNGWSGDFGYSLFSRGTAKDKERGYKTVGKVIQEEIVKAIMSCYGESGKGGAEAVDIKEDRISLDLNSSGAQLNVALTPADAGDAITWQSSDASVATVDYKGKVTVRGLGTCLVVAKTPGGLFDYCIVEVVPPQTFLAGLYAQTSNWGSAAGKDYLEIAADGDISGTLTLSASKAQFSPIRTLFIKDVAVQNGASKYSNLKSATFVIKSLKINGTEMELDKTEYQHDKAATKSGELDICLINAWSDADAPSHHVLGMKKADQGYNFPEDAYVDGTNTITIELEVRDAVLDIEKAEEPVRAESIAFGQESLEIEAGQSASVSAVTTPADATEKLMWFSEDDKVAAVDSTGTVTGGKTGGTVIHMVSASGLHASIPVTVVLPPEATEEPTLPPEPSLPPAPTDEPEESQEPGADQTAAPGTDATATPGVTDAPGTDATTVPGVTEAPGTDATTAPGVTEAPGTDTTAAPGVTQTPDGTAAPGANATAEPAGTEKPDGTAAPNGTTAPGSKDKTDKGSGQKKVTVKKASLKKVRSTKKKTLTAEWKKVSGASGYQAVVSLDKKFKKGKKTVTVKSQKTVKVTVRKLKSKKKYFVKVRAYKTVKGKKNYGSWSKVKSVKVK